MKYDLLICYNTWLIYEIVNKFEFGWHVKVRSLVFLFNSSKTIITVKKNIGVRFQHTKTTMSYWIHAFGGIL